MLDLIFQNGELTPDNSSFWQDLLTSAIGACIGAGGALLVYWLQVQRERDLKATTQHTQNKADVEYFQLVLKDALAFVKVQSKIRLDYADNIMESPYEAEPLTSYPTLPLIRLEKVDHEKMHHLFLTTQGDDATKKFKNIYKYIDYFTKSFDTIDTTIEKDSNETQILKQKYIKQFKDLEDATSIKSNKIKYGLYKGEEAYKTDTLFVFLNKIVSDYHENRVSTTDLVYHQTQFVRKLNEGLVMDGFIQDTDCLNLALSAKNLTHLFSDIKFNVESLASYIRVYGAALQKELENFTDSVNKIVIKDKIQIRLWYHIFYTPGQ